MSLSIGGIDVGAGHPCRFVAEISNNHNGDLARAHRLIDAAKASGADFLKTQAFEVSELIALRGDGPAPEPWGSQGWTMAALYEKARTPFEWFPELFQHARAIGLVPFSSVFGEDSWRVLRGVDCPAYKIARLDNQSRHLTTVAQMPNRIVIVSTAGERTPPTIVPTLRLLCPIGYPQAAPFFSRDAFTDDGMPDAFDGFSYHGIDPTVPAAAGVLGASLVECHVQLDDEPSELEANVSLTASQFAQMIASVRAVEAMLT